MKEITQDIKLIVPVETKSEEFSVTALLEGSEPEVVASLSTEPAVTYIPEAKLQIVYESSNYKAKKMIPYFIIGLLLILSLFLILFKIE